MRGFSKEKLFDEVKKIAQGTRDPGDLRAAAMKAGYTCKDLSRVDELERLLISLAREGNKESAEWLAPILRGACVTDSAALCLTVWSCVAQGAALGGHREWCDALMTKWMDLRHDVALGAMNGQHIGRDRDSQLKYLSAFSLITIPFLCEAFGWFSRGARSEGIIICDKTCRIAQEMSRVMREDGCSFADVKKTHDYMEEYSVPTFEEAHGLCHSDRIGRGVKLQFELEHEETSANPGFIARVDGVPSCDLTHGLFPILGGDTERELGY